MALLGSFLLAIPVRPTQTTRWSNGYPGESDGPYREHTARSCGPPQRHHEPLGIDRAHIDQFVSVAIIHGREISWCPIEDRLGARWIENDSTALDPFSQQLQGRPK